MQRQANTYKEVFGDPQFDPPPYPSSLRDRSESSASTAAESSQPLERADSTSVDAQGPPPPYHTVGRGLINGVEKPAIPKDSLVLVTGANGWLGMHVVDQLLEHGYRVRGTVRSAEHAVSTSGCFSRKYGPGRFTTAVIPDMVPKDAFHIAVRGCAGVIHVASVMNFSPDPNEVIAPSIAGALNALEAAAKESGVKRFVYCSASAAAVAQGSGYREDVTSDSWNMASFRTAWEPPPYEIDRAWAVFASSKMQTEQAVWRWYNQREWRVNFALNTVLPSMLWGKVLDMQAQGIRSTVAELKLIYGGNAAATAWIPPQYFVDVQDAALLHVAALLLPDIKGQRLFAAESPYNINSLLQLLRGLYPDRVFEGDVSDHGADLSVFKEAPKAEALLKRMGKQGWTDIETSIGRSCEAFMTRSGASGSS
ncbi:hypothetical protein BAUCODRAFT_76019 [Baudoinia panamericana UAMH 10762]|uniref:NAD-dependent epimerase/dehydratase domain-containing protein n=1 Tax=Baudoinia panamericana (strain UAMH 10762) TaxID=717646 RepID=M2N3D5_BAUPA|nr:uncharacterized protein BAUCODRAFT_76019 [Baudoinia panamericana UAMH 10762]EMC93230.1 hypothetical protein BAUCODRAFT_76019 [Baudoinia panamericana UAMH 10762]